jgi:hypothetical protein
MGFTKPNLDVNRAPRQLISLLTSLAVAVTFFRFSAARLQAEKDAKGRTTD